MASEFFLILKAWIGLIHLSIDVNCIFSINKIGM